MDEYRILSPTAILGYGFPIESFAEGMAKKPHLIAVDAGSTDPGPYYLGAGVSFTEKQAVKRDLKIILKAALKSSIPVIIGTAGGSGAHSHLVWNLEIIKEIATEESLDFKVATINAEIGKEEVLDFWNKKKITPLPPGPELTIDDIESTVKIVGQMGIEPITKSLETGAEVVLAGRCYDPAVFAASAIAHGFDPGLAVHMGKILECAAIAATPGSGSDCLLGYLHQDDFEVEPTAKNRKCTALSVAAHTLYEKSNPFLLPGPGGTLDLSNTSFQEVGDRRVRVIGSKFIPSEQYEIKMEGVRRVGFRTVSIAGSRDPIMIKKIDPIVSAVKAEVAANFGNVFHYNLNFKIYGKNGVMGFLEPHPKPTGHEICIIIDVVSKTQEQADTICGFARSTMLHYGYEGRISTAGNLAFPYSPSDFKAGEVYAFSIYHLVEVEDPCRFFQVEVNRL